MMRTLILDGNSLTLDDILQVANRKINVQIDDTCLNKIDATRKHIDAIAQQDKPYYGINTGFGALAETPISKSDIHKLQHNLIISHAVGVGAPLSIAESRALMLLRANTLAKGHSGCRSLILSYLTTLLNAGCAPYVPSKGSVGASGDLAPLSHLALLLLGLGDAFIGDKLVTAKDALAHANLSPLTLQAKEGLALINGTQAMAAVGALACLEAEKLFKFANTIGAMTLDALLGSIKPFDARIHAVRPHIAQQQSAEQLRYLLRESELQMSHRNCKKVQDAYSLRCMPQVHGASKQVFDHVRSVLMTEINSATDNPLVFAEDSHIDIVSGGNFHGQPVALALDYLAMGLATLGTVSERRIEQMVNASLSDSLPPFLAPSPGLNSGFMILHVTASALVNENKILCHPASCDTVPTSANREDHVSMGMNAALKAAQVLRNVRTILAIELMAAAQALDLRAPLKTSPSLQKILKTVREKVPFAAEDREFRLDLEQIQNLLASDELAD